MFTDINIYPINNKTDHFSEKYIFIFRNHIKTKFLPDKFEPSCEHEMKILRNIGF